MIDVARLPLSPKQIDYVLDSDAFVNLAEGAIRAGKTASGLFRWLLFVAQDAPTTGDLVVCSKTYDTATRNIFNPLRDPALFGDLAKASSYTRGAPTARILGEQVEVITFNDERSESRLRGMTCRGGYVDEWSLMPETFHEQLVGRCSVDGAQLFGNTNPDGPRHWLKRKIDVADPDWRTFRFVLDDNPKLSERVKDRYRRQYTGLWYRRMILGEWCLAEGAVFDMYDDAKHVVTDEKTPPIVRWIACGIDYGTSNPFHAVLLGLGDDGRLYVHREWRHDGRAERRQMTDAQYSTAVREWLRGLAVEPDYVIVDPSAASFRVQLHKDGLATRKANNEVVDGIRTMSSLFARDRLRINASCKGLLNELPAYSWDDKASEQGRDEPVKVDDHGVDATRYALHTTRAVWWNLLRPDELDYAA